MKKRIQVHIPYRMLIERLEDVLSAGLNPEIYTDAATLDSIRPKDLKDTREILVEKGLRITLHGPYMDLSPGASDEKIRLITVERYRQTFEAAQLLLPETIVLHAGYDERRFDGDVPLWLSQSRKTWPRFIKEAEKMGSVIAVENVFEENPLPIKRLVESMNSPNFRVCFDTGHLNLFSKVKMEEWFNEIGSKVSEVHLHDNRGKWDEHLIIGDGNIDFPLFFSLLKKYSHDPVYTVELHGEEVLWKGLEAARRFIEG